MKRLFFLPYRVFVALNYIYGLVKSKLLVASFLTHGNNIFLGRIGKLKNPHFICVGNNVIFGDYIFLTAWSVGTNNPRLVIGDNCSFGAFNHISSSNSVIIGNNVLTGKYVTIVDNCHGDSTLTDLTQPPTQRPIRSKGPVVIEDDVWIGDKATILQNVKLGKGSVIAANAVVTMDVPPYSVAAGVPAKIIKLNKYVI